VKRPRALTGRVYCTKHGKPLYLQPEGIAVCIKGCFIVLKRSIKA
jgi:hypothetical protein